MQDTREVFPFHVTYHLNIMQLCIIEVNIYSYDVARLIGTEYAFSSDLARRRSPGETSQLTWEEAYL